MSRELEAGAPPAPERRLVTIGNALFIFMMVGAFLVRVWDVGARAMHLDESTVAWFAWQLLTGHGYAYDPVYHGPFQHEMLAAIFLLFQPSETSARMLAVVLGTALVALPWFIRDYLGRLSALIACFLIAVSPSFVYFARFERDDTYMEFFTFLVVVFVLRYLRDRRPWQLYGAATAFAVAFATKESIYIVAFMFVSFVLLLQAGAWTGDQAESTTTEDGEARLGKHPYAGFRRLMWRLRSGAGDAGAVPRVVLLGFAVALALGLAITFVTGLYAPVPLIVALLMIVFVGARGLVYRRAPDAGLVGASTNNGSTAMDGGTASTPGSRPIPGRRPVASSPFRVIRGIGSSVWINSATIAVAIIVLMYSTFGTNLNGLWDHAHPFFNTGHTCSYSLALNLDACRRDIIGGLFYWLSQDKVARGGQPWYYYALIYGLYEQIAVLFGTFAIVRTLLRPRDTFRVFLVYWAVLAVGIYSWAGEKFPWLGIHPLLPLTLLAALGIVDLFRLRPASLTRMGMAHPTAGRLVPAAGGAIIAILLLFELHNTYVLNFVDGANPVEMMVYVQSAPDTVRDAHTIERLSHQATQGPTLGVTIDALDSWPFAWYLRNMPNVAYPAAAQLKQATYLRNPIILVDQSDALDVPSSLTRTYRRSLDRLDWWFPEDYKTWTWSTFWRRTFNPSSWRAIWSWETTRTPFGPRDGSWYYMYIKKGYFSPY